MNIKINKDINKYLKDKFYIVLDKDIEYNLNILKLKRIESIGLLKQTYITLNNSEKSLKSYNFVDSSSLLRNALEYLSMVVMIEANEDAYEEFKIVSEDSKLKRNYTSPERIIKNFAIKLGNIVPELFGDMSNRQKLLMIDTDLYNVLSRYTHASIVVSLHEHMYSSAEKKIIRLFMNNTLDLIKYIYLRVLNNYNQTNPKINEDRLLTYNVIFFYKLNINLTNNIDKNKLVDLLYYNTTNKYYYTKLVNRVEGIKKDIIDHPLTENQIAKINEILTEEFK